MKIKNTLLLMIMTAGLLLSCKNESTSTEDKKSSAEDGSKNTEAKMEADGKYTLDQDMSIVSWIGSKPAGTHNGQIKIKSGEMKFEKGELRAAKFTADMTSINVMDLEGEEKMDLENHLKGKIEGKEDHFFNVDKYPESLFKLKSISAENGMYNVYGELKIRDRTNPIEFKANLEWSESANSVKLISEEFTIDRTKWGIEFMSKSVFDDLKERFIDDEIKLKVELKADKVS